MIVMWLLKLQMNVKVSKKSKYNLPDGEDDDEFEGIDTLGRDDFEEQMLDEYEDDETDST